jgi:hypothetical protein
MSRRDERDIARRLGDLPAGEPPADLLARLQADVPPRVAVGEEAAARRRPAVRPWLLAASLAATVGAGLLAQRTMRHMEPLPALAGRPAAPAGGEKAVTPPPAPSAVTAGPSTARRPAAIVPPMGTMPPIPRPLPALPRAAAPERGGMGAGPPAPPESPAERVIVMDDQAQPSAPAPAAAPAASAAAGGEESAIGRLRQPVAADSAADSAAGLASQPAVSAPAGGAAALPAARAKGERSAAMAMKRQAIPSTVPGEPEGGEARRDAPERPPAVTVTASGAAEVQAFAASYDTDAEVDRAGWSLAAGAAPPPPAVAGHPVLSAPPPGTDSRSRPAPGTRWVRFRVRAMGSALAGEVGDGRVEIAWSPAAVERRLLGGGPAAGAVDVYALTPAALRRGWTAVYEVRFAPEAVRAAAGPLATLRVRDAGSNGPPERELILSDFSPSWRNAPAALRLPCLAAAFAERQAQGGREDLSDLLAAVRSLAAATGDRRADDLVVRMLRASRPSHAGPP